MTLAAALGMLIVAAPVAGGQVSLPSTGSLTGPTSGTTQAPSTSPTKVVDDTTNVVKDTTTTTKTATTTTTTTTNSATGQTTTTVKDKTGKTISSTTATTGAPAPAGPAPAGPAPSGATAAGFSSVIGAPGTTIRLPNGAVQTLTMSTPLPPGTRFETIGPPPPPLGPNVMSPFPVVRIAGTLTRRGAKVRVLSARAPSGALGLAICRGRACPRVTASATIRARASQSSGRVRFRALQRTYSAGTVLRVYVTGLGKFGKYTRFEIRRGLAPERDDRCMAPGAGRRPMRCSAIPRG